MTESAPGYIRAAEIREVLRKEGWVLLSHTQGQQGITPIHNFAFGHPHGSWVIGIGASEELALKEVAYKIERYNLRVMVVPPLPYELNVEDTRVYMRFGSELAAHDFSTWLHRVKESKRGR